MTGEAVRWPGWRWLAPALAGSFMALLALGPRQEGLGSSSLTGTNFFAAVTSNPNYAAYVMAGFHSEQNGPQRETLEWTFGSRSTSRMGSLPAVATNHLLH